jgi:Kef-type K+ transport systems, membrane components
VIVGFIAANSATAVLAKILADRGEMDSPHGQSVLAITLFNDLIAVPVIALIPLLAGRTAGSTGVIAKFGWSLAAITAVFSFSGPPFPGFWRASSGRGSGSFSFYPPFSSAWGWPLFPGPWDCPWPSGPFWPA